MFNNNDKQEVSAEDTGTFDPQHKFNSDVKTSDDLGLQKQSFSQNQPTSDIIGQLIEEIISENNEDENKRSNKSFTFDIEGDTIDRVIGQMEKIEIKKVDTLKVHNKPKRDLSEIDVAKDIMKVIDQ